MNVQFQPQIAPQVVPQVAPVIPQVVERRQIRAELNTLEAELAQYEQNINGLDKRIKDWLRRFQEAVSRQEDVRPLMQQFEQELRQLLKHPVTGSAVRYLLDWLSVQNQPAPAVDEEEALVQEIEARYTNEALAHIEQEARLIAQADFAEESQRSQAFYDSVRGQIQELRNNDNVHFRELGARIEQLARGPNPQLQQLQQKVSAQLIEGVRALQQRVASLQAQNAGLSTNIATVNASNQQLSARVNEAERKLRDNDNSWVGELCKAVAIIAICMVANQALGSIPFSI